MWTKQTVRDIDPRGKNILLRADYNVPLEQGRIVEDYRIRASLPTIRYLLEHGAQRIVLISHLGRPEGVDPDLSLAPVARRLEQLLGQPVQFARNDAPLPPAGLVMLENLRFSPDEEAGSVEFAMSLVERSAAELFVQDAFGAVHRAHSSIVALAQLLPSVAGLLLEHEVKTISQMMEKPERPFLAIIGGAKVADKQPLIDLFAKTADQVALGGRLGLELAATPENVVVPLDYRYGYDHAPYDLGEITTAKIIALIQEAETIVWNGVVGKVEDPIFAEASRRLAEAIGRRKAKSLILGGDTASFVINCQERDPQLHYALISTGGGSALELILGQKLPGIEVLPDKTA